LIDRKLLHKTAVYQMGQLLSLKYKTRQAYQIQNQKVTKKGISKSD